MLTPRSPGSQTYRLGGVPGERRQTTHGRARRADRVVAFCASWARLSSFARLLRANTGAARSLNDELVAAHGITIEQYEILCRLALFGEPAPGRSRRAAASHSRAPMTRADHPGANGLVHRSGEGDSSEVALTDAGREKVRAARNPQLEGLFGLGSPPN